MNRFLATLSFALLTLCGPVLHAGDVTVAFTSSTRSLATYDFGGTPLADGSIVRIGTFTDGLTTNFSLLQNSTDFSALDAIFTPLAEGFAGAGTINQTQPVPPTNPTDSLVANDFTLTDPGRVFGQITNTSTSYLSAGTQLYMWAFNSNDVSSVTPGDWGIFTTSDSSWSMPTDIALDPLYNLVMTGSDLTILAVRGSLTGSQMQFGIVPVPEPSSVLLLTAAGILALRRKRARR